MISRVTTSKRIPRSSPAAVLSSLWCGGYSFALSVQSTGLFTFFLISPISFGAAEGHVAGRLGTPGEVPTLEQKHWDVNGLGTIFAMMFAVLHLR